MGEANEKVPMIYAAICGVMEDVGAVGKDNYNEQQRFKYRGIDAVMNALNPAMIKHKVFCTPEVLEQTREERSAKNGGNLIYSVCRMRYRFYTTDGSFVETVVVGEGMDSGDKATNKAMAVAFKYACFQTFCIPTENLMDDPDKETPPPSTKKPDNEVSHNTKMDDSKGNPKQADDETSKLLKELADELIRTGYGSNAVLKKYKVDSMEQMTKLQLKDCISKMKNVPDKEVS